MMLILLTWAMWPNDLTNPTVTPKAWILSFISLASFFFLAQELIKQKNSSVTKIEVIQIKQNLVSGVVILLIVSLFVSTAVNLTDLNWKLFGTEERRTGLLYYLALILLGVLMAKVYDPRTNINILIRGLAICNLGVTGYAILQSRGIDFSSFETIYQSSSSFLGNPNLVSGFVGMSCWAHFWTLGVKKSSTRIILNVAYLPPSLLVNAFVLYRNGSLSGIFAVFVAMFSALLFFTFRILFMHQAKMRKSSEIIVRFLALLLTIPLMLFPVILTFDYFRNLMINLGGATRFAYWKVALRIFIDEPILGKGPEPFASYFLRFRHPQDLEFIGLKQNVDSPHSLPLEILTVGGLSLFIPFVLLVFASLYNTSKAYILRTAKRNSNEIIEIRNGLILSLIILGFLSQSIINVSNIAISSWGVSFIAISIRLYLQNKEPELSIKEFPPDHSQLVQNSNSFLFRFRELTNLNWARPLFIFIFAGIILFGFLGHTRILINELKFVNAVEHNNGEEMIRISGSWPQDERRILGVALSLENAKLHTESLALLRNGVASFPNSIQMWILLERNPLLDERSRLSAMQRILGIDPLYNRS
jgi:hypothetical protein